MALILMDAWLTDDDGMRTRIQAVFVAPAFVAPVSNSLRFALLARWETTWPAS